MSPQGAGVSCTSGFGYHDPDTGDDLVLTAGHCAYHVVHTEDPVDCCAPEWYNTSASDPDFSSSSPPYMGAEDWWAALYSDWGFIPASSNDEAWAAGDSKVSLVGEEVPPGGATVCEDGTVGGYQCGAVVATGVSQPINLEPSGSEDPVELTEVALVLTQGDSGGAAWTTTSAGNEAVGINVGTNNTSDSWIEELWVIEDAFELTVGIPIALNTVSDP